MPNSDPLQAMQKDNFCIDSLIAHMHRTLIKAIGCVTVVIEFHAENVSCLQ